MRSGFSASRSIKIIAGFFPHKRIKIYPVIRRSIDWLITSGSFFVAHESWWMVGAASHWSVIPGWGIFRSLSASPYARFIVNRSTRDLHLFSSAVLN